ncbi:hypothetical protein [Pseudarthrobacter sp. C4D7]|uniref:hypothetical protein n=1 Tax=Pseudarthrobacter sp. C4D7 TaxID=2735268 RepID=UPI0015845986|nr:hypothetical protein [Pseudarthrobacter sp. C4D7]NUT70615.1 hypothetical protein [Pseudarthrobacter sp. C4D7]
MILRIKGGTSFLCYRFQMEKGTTNQHHFQAQKGMATLVGEFHRDFAEFAHGNATKEAGYGKGAAETAPADYENSRQGIIRRKGRSQAACFFEESAWNRNVPLPVTVLCGQPPVTGNGRLAAEQRAREDSRHGCIRGDRGKAHGISNGRERIDEGIPFASQSHHYPNLLFCCPLRELRCGLEPRQISAGSEIKVPQVPAENQQFRKKVWN